MSSEDGWPEMFANLCQSGCNDPSDAPVPSVVLRNVRSHPAVAPHVIVFANEKGGVGKSTLAFHSAVALSHSGARVLAIDIDYRQKTLTTSCDMRAATARALKVDLPSATYLTLEKQSGAMLDQEIRRAGGAADFVVIDLPGADTPTCRYAIAIADTIVTPIGSSAYDIGGLGRVNPVTNALIGPGMFAKLVQDLGEERSKAGLSKSDWIVMKNRWRSGERRLEAKLDVLLSDLALQAGFRIGSGLHESLSFRDLNAYGLTYLDIGRIPALGKRNYRTEGAIAQIVRQLRLPGFCRERGTMQRGNSPADRRVIRPAPVSSSQSQSYEAALRSHRNSR